MNILILYKNCGMHLYGIKRRTRLNKIFNIKKKKIKACKKEALVFHI